MQIERLMGRGLKSLRGEGFSRFVRLRKPFDVGENAGVPCSVIWTSVNHMSLKMALVCGVEIVKSGPDAVLMAILCISMETAGGTCGPRYMERTTRI